jgi:hypothetical protein
MSGCGPEHPWDDDDVEDDDEWEFDCQMYHDGQCGAAGSEDCEFECPYRAMQRRAEREGKHYP